MVKLNAEAQHEMKETLLVQLSCILTALTLTCAFSSFKLFLGENTLHVTALIYTRAALSLHVKVKLWL